MKKDGFKKAFLGLIIVTIVFCGIFLFSYFLFGACQKFDKTSKCSINDILVRSAASVKKCANTVLIFSKNKINVCYKKARRALVAVRNYGSYRNYGAQKNKFTFWSIQLKPVFEKEITEIIKEFEKKHNVEVVWVDIPIGEAQKRTLASILSSTPPDLINLNPEFSMLLAKKNALYTFSNAQTSQYNPNLVEKLKYNDKIYALPFYWTSPVTLYDEKVFRDCVSDKFIQNYDELPLIFEKFKNCPSRPRNMALFTTNLGEGDTFSRILNKYDVWSGDLKTSVEYSNKVFSMFDDMYKESALLKDTLTINHREAVEKYMSQNALIIVLGSNFINSIKDNAPLVYKNSQIAPQLTAGELLLGADEGRKNIGAFDISLMNLIIPKKSKHIDLALEFANILTNRENQLELSKITNVLPANKEALEDSYFKNCTDDLFDKSRCMSVLQLEKLTIDTTPKAALDNKKEYQEFVNSALEEILLSPPTALGSDKNFIEAKVKWLITKYAPKLD